jgi:hypothetical protein
MAAEPLSDEERHKKYVTRRRRWARSVGRPYVGHEAELPDPAVIDGADEQEG